MGAAAHVGIFIQAVRPALGDALLGPQVVRVLGQRVDQLLHLGGQRHSAQVERRWFVAVALKNAKKMKFLTKMVFLFFLPA